jgi:hypothetical protein
VKSTSPRQAGFYCNMDERFDELFEDLKYLKVELTELPLQKIQMVIIDELREILNMGTNNIRA